MKKKKLLLTTTLLSLLYSCTSTSTKDLLPEATGKSGSIVVVMQKDIFNSAIKDTIQKYLAPDYKPTLREEKQFSLLPTLDKQFGKIQKQRANIIDFMVDPALEKPEVSLNKNVWAKKQRLITVEAPSKEELIAFIQKNASSWVDYFNTIERKRLISKYSDISNKKIQKKLAKQGIFLAVPRDAKLEPIKDDFIYITRFRERKLMTRNENRSLESVKHSVLQGILIYEFPYKDTNTFTLPYLINKRDSIIKKVPFSNQDAFMYTVYSNNNDTLKYWNPTLSVIDNIGDYAVEIKGLWSAENQYMGGTFITLAVLNQKENKIIMLDSYLYAPKFGKREYMRELESILYSYKTTTNEKKI